jgi:asparagine synthase (glutamine-hydrolysing)
MRWREALAEPGFRLLHANASAAMKVQRLTSGSGVILGSLFRRKWSIDEERLPQTQALEEREEIKILQSRGRRLIEAFWGDYVALLTDAESGVIWAIKDPTGDLPCLYTTYKNVTLIFSCVGDCVRLGLFKASINWEYVRLRVTSGGFLSGKRSLQQVDQVHRGEAVAIDTSRRPAEFDRRLYWSPLRFNESENPIESVDFAACALRNTVKAATHALSAAHESALLRVSGGLDSSIIVGCLKSTSVRTRITAFTYYNPDGGSTERRWAHLAMQGTPYEHIETPIDPREIDLAGILDSVPTMEPAPLLMYRVRRPLETRLAASRGCTAVISGDGGDSSLGSESRGLAASEYLNRHGFDRRMLALAAQVAISNDASIWTVLSKAFRRKLMRSSVREYTSELLCACRLVSPDVVKQFAKEAEFAHPWFAGCNRIPWEIVHRLGSLLMFPEFYDPFSHADDEGLLHLAPLYSQPVLELCLRIPTYVHFWGGRDRGLARYAFAAEVPQAILRRQWKDRAPGFAQAVAHRNREFLKQVLLDGMLVNERILNRRAVADALTDGPMKHDVLIAEIFKVLDVEIWLRAITGASGSSAAA